MTEYLYHESLVTTASLEVEIPLKLLRTQFIITELSSANPELSNHIDVRTFRDYYTHSHIL